MISLDVFFYKIITILIQDNIFFELKIGIDLWLEFEKKMSKTVAKGHKSETSIILIPYYEIRIYFFVLFYILC